MKIGLELGIFEIKVIFSFRTLYGNGFYFVWIGLFFFEKGDKFILGRSKCFLVNIFG